MRFKGDYSYRGFPGKKRPIKLDFDRFVNDQEHDGQTKLNLHNFAGDPSFLRETLAYGLLREQGLPASRTAYAQVYVNDSLLGLYLLVEEINKRFCRSRFGDTGTLYQCTDNTEMAWQGDDPAAYTDEFKLDHDANNVGWMPLLDLMKLMHEDRSAVFRQRLDAIFNVDSYLHAMVLDVLLNNWDSYHDNGRNFSLYHSAEDGRLHWIPWDYNLCLWERDMELPPRDRSADGYKPLVARIANDPLLMEDLWRTACDALSRVQLPAIHDRLAASRALIADAVAADPNKFYSTSAFHANLYHTVVVSMRRNGVPTDVALPGVYDRLVKRLSTLKLLAQRKTDCTSPDRSDLIVHVFPNPSAGTVTVRWDLRSDAVTAMLDVFDALGRPVLQHSYDPAVGIREERLTLAAGHYLVRITAGPQQSTHRLMVT
ncbi:MAG: CotH kinase family protein [Flavobacteriales bacterium]|nr:CotH kinase family protein [Flavobacteriales bacterium]